MTGTDFFFDTPDGLTLHAKVRRHPAASARPPVIICLPGLTRNERDFEGLAGWLTSRSFSGPACEVVCLTFRGRGRSARDANYLNYHPSTYAGDVETLMAARGISEAIFIGTSLGGITTMLLAAARPGAITAACLNDVGPELAPEGLARIAGYVGGAAPFPGWAEAAEAIRATNGVAFPDRDASFWNIFARRTCVETAAGVELDYDLAIARALMEAGAAPPLDPGFLALSGPLLSVRGSISDLLTPEIVESMQARQPHMVTCDIPNVGHAPTLEEPEARKAIQRWLEGI